MEELFRGQSNSGACTPVSSRVCGLETTATCTQENICEIYKDRSPLCRKISRYVSSTLNDLVDSSIFILYVPACQIDKPI